MGPASRPPTWSGPSTGSPASTAGAAGTATRPAAPGSAWRSSARPPRPTAAPRTWSPPSLRHTPRACAPWSASRRPADRALPAAPGEEGGDGYHGEKQGQVADRQVEQAHRDRPHAAYGTGVSAAGVGHKSVQPVRLGQEPAAESERDRSVDPH